MLYEAHHLRRFHKGPNVLLRPPSMLTHCWLYLIAMSWRRWHPTNKLILLAPTSEQNGSYQLNMLKIVVCTIRKVQVLERLLNKRSGKSESLLPRGNGLYPPGCSNKLEVSIRVKFSWLTIFLSGSSP